MQPSYSSLESVEIDLVMDNGTTFTTHETVERYRSDPELSDQFIVSPDEGGRNDRRSTSRRPPSTTCTSARW